MKITGKEFEKTVFKQLLNSEKPEFVAIHGRRRVGKTYITSSFFEANRCTFFHSTGLRNADQAQQIKQFTDEISRVFYAGQGLSPASNWYDAFAQLTRAIENLKSKKKIIVFLDELPWMATPKSDLMSSLEFYWNRHWYKESRMCLITCGSSASWVQENIIDNKDGLYNRVTRVIRVQPFTLLETREFLKSKKINYPEKQVCEIYMALGGIPYYLDFLQAHQSVAENIESVFFTPNAPLVDEFDRLYASLFNNHELYEDIVRVMAKNRYGIGISELAEHTRQTKGGSFQKRLDELEEAGFIEKFLPYQNNSRGHYYRLIDEFSIFYLHWVEPYKKDLKKRDRGLGFWMHASKSPSFYAWAGYAFEALCYKHIKQIREGLNITPDSLIATWRYSPPKGSKGEGAQIDLLFDRPDGAITLCEIKYTQKILIIDKAMHENLNQKKRVFQVQTKSEKLIFMALISAQGVKKNIYSESLTHLILTLENLFKA